MTQLRCNRNIDELESHAVMWWPDSLSQQNANISVIPKLLKTQDAFLDILSLSKNHPDQVFALITAAEFPVNLFLKHLCILADYGGEPLQRLGRSFEDIFVADSCGIRTLNYTWNGQNYAYIFKGLPATIGNSQLNIDGDGLRNDILKLTPLYRDVIMLLMHGATSQACDQGALSKCEIGSIMGNDEILGNYVKQRYVAVSRITGGASANTLGQLAQCYVIDLLKEKLGDSYDVKSNGKIQLIGYDKEAMPFDIVVTSSSKTFGIEISFQVTTNSTIERKAGQSASRQNLMHKNGHLIAYIIDGAGNFQRRSAIKELCNHSDCTVAYSAEEIGILANWIKQNDA
jgi:hypothetical protein